MSLLWNRPFFKTYDESFMSLLWNRRFFKTYDESFMSLLWNRRFLNLRRILHVFALEQAFLKPTTNPSCLCTGTGVFKTYDESFMSLLWNRRF